MISYHNIYLSWIDYAIIIIIALSCLVSLVRGFLREVLSLVIWGAAFFFSTHYYTYIAVWLTSFKDKIIQNGIAIIVLFIVILIFGSIINYITGKFLEKTGLSGTDQVLGIFFGLLRGVLIVVVMLFFLDSFTEVSKSEDWQKSQFIPYFSSLIKWMFDYLHSSSNLLRT